MISFNQYAPNKETIENTLIIQQRRLMARVLQHSFREIVVLLQFVELSVIPCSVRYVQHQRASTVYPNCAARRVSSEYLHPFPFCLYLRERYALCRNGAVRTFHYAVSAFQRHLRCRFRFREYHGEQVLPWYNHKRRNVRRRNWRLHHRIFSVQKWNL